MKPLYRHFDLRASNAENDLLTITGMGVPFDSETELAPGYFERFAPGSVRDDGAILRYAHSEPLGPILTANDTPNGREITARISDTQRGRDVATMIRDGVLSKLSIGFLIDSYEEDKRDDGTHITITSARALEYSIVEFPAYEAATITNFRHTNNPAPEEKDTIVNNTTTPPLTEVRADIAALNQAVEDLSREMRSAREIAAPTPEFRSLGHYAKELAAQSERAKATFAGAIIGETIARPAWLGVLEKRMAAKQILTNLFTHTYDLAPTGMTVEYAKRKGESTVQVKKQAKEGDTLASGKPAAYEVKAAAVATYGGYGSMSLQAIERSSVSLLDDLLYEQAMVYAMDIERETRELFKNLVTTNEADPAHTFASLANSTVNEWTDALSALVDEYDDTPYVFDGLIVSPSVFSTLAKMPRDPKALQFVSAPDNHHGTISVPTGEGKFSTIHVQRLPKWEGNHATAYTREAIWIQEAAGAPWRLQNTEILDLTRNFAVYGYASHFAPHPDLLMPLTFTA